MNISVRYFQRAPKFNIQETYVSLHIDRRTAIEQQLATLERADTCGEQQTGAMSRREKVDIKQRRIFGHAVRAEELARLALRRLFAQHEAR